MSKPANKTVLGGFVVAAIALFVAAVLVFGSAKFFKKTELRVMYFEGSVKGLNVGAPVLFRGVKIGSVKEIRLQWNVAKNEMEIPVIAEYDPDAFKIVGGSVDRGDPVKNQRELVEKGLRAQLEMQSFVTGQLLIAVDFHPGTPVRLHKDAPYLETPTIPTTMQRIAQTIQELPLKEMVTNLNSVIESIEKLVSSQELKDSLASLNLLLEAGRKLIQEVNGQVGPLASGLKDMTTDARKLVRNTDERLASLGSGAEATLNDTRHLIKNIDSRVAPIQGQLNGTLEAASVTINRAEKTLAEIEKTTKNDSPLIYRLTRTLEEMEKLARSVRVLADYLERHPEAIIKGKGSPGGK